MYSRINELLNKGFSERKTAKILGVNRGTVKKYKEMSLDEYKEPTLPPKLYNYNQLYS